MSETSVADRHGQARRIEQTALPGVAVDALPRLLDHRVRPGGQP